MQQKKFFLRLLGGAIAPIAPPLDPPLLKYANMFQNQNNLGKDTVSIGLIYGLIY